MYTNSGLPSEMTVFPSYTSVSEYFECTVVQTGMPSVAASAFAKVVLPVPGFPSSRMFITSWPVPSAA